jgi:hypothetical protein
MVQNGPAIRWVRSTTLMPASGPADLAGCSV